ncbi:MAG: tetratricopeptide repeat protein [Sphingobium sp.]
MIGWLIAFALTLALTAGLILARLPRIAWEITGAALLLGLAGYAWQGHPDLPGAPRARAETREGEFDEKLAERRRGLAERYGPAGQWLTMSDAYGRRGLTKEAANILLSGLRANPRDASLWLGLGNALMAHMDGNLSPGAEFAYRRALALEPDAPAPRYFYGMALLQAGQLREARAQWAPLAASAPADSALRRELLAALARMDAQLQDGQPSRTPAPSGPIAPARQP